jgi:RNA polymerase sigma-70 factor (ECF subfamily)
MSVESDTSESLMIRYQNGSVSAFEDLYGRSVARVRAWLSRRLDSPERVEDCVQKVFLRLHHARHQFRGDEIFEAWLFSIVRTVWLDELRYQTRHPDIKKFIPLEEVPESHWVLTSPSVGHPFEDPEYETALAQLSLDHREALQLRYQEEQPFRGMARKWRVTEAAARKRVSRAVSELKKLLTQSQEESGVVEKKECSNE